MQQDMLARIYKEHFLAGKCKACARPIMYWLGMSRDMESRVAECGVCARIWPANQKEPLLPHSIPDCPWQKLGADIFHFGGKDHLILLDDFLKFPELSQLNGLMAFAGNSEMKANFSCHRIPEEVFTDNVPFGSAEIKDFGEINIVQKINDVHNLNPNISTIQRPN